MLEVLFIIAYTLSTAWVAALCGIGRWRLSYQEVPLMSTEWFYIERWRRNREDSEANKKNKKTYLTN